ncbi:MBL fold metallo-hydrolase [Candidatus Microgenomates bacterium]|nr:MBL fold metallo-hydrolase [Candidatus Microgenomates bacterium]
MRKYSIIFITFLLSLLLLFVFSLPDRNLHFIVCDIGQGDALLVTLGTMQILVDGGPDKKVLSCLGKHMPFWDRKIDIVMVTNPDLDHYGGLVDVVRNYQVGTFIRPNKEGDAAGWNILLGEVNKRKIPQHFAKTGQQIRYTDLHFDILHPASDFIASSINEYSVVGTLSYREFDVLLTGDIMPPATNIAASGVHSVEVLKVPHHGSKNGLTQEMLLKSDPKLALISCGRNNRYGHPHEEILDMLAAAHVKTLRTDQDGEIEVVSDGQSFWLKAN